MRNLVKDIAHLQQIEEAKAPKGSKPDLKPMKPRYKDPVHVVGIGIMERGQAEKHFPGVQYRETNMYKDIKEAVETKIQMTMPLFIRLMEWAKEDAQSDMELHRVAENLAAVNGIADMDVYNDLVNGVSDKEDMKE